MLFAAIYVPDFAAAAVLRTDPALREQPLAILEGTAPLLRVMGMNEVARLAGIEVGMTKLQAEALTGVALRQRLPAQEEAAHVALLDCAHAFSPRVEPLAPDVLLLDIAGLERLFGPPPSIARKLAERASALGLEVNVAVAANREAAILAAHGFPGITIIAAGEEAQRLGPLPIDVLFSRDISPQDIPDNGKRENVQRFLDTCGVHTLRAFAALPTVAIAERLGQEGVRLQQLARGIGSQSLIAAEPPMKFEEAIELEHSVDLLEPLAFILSRLLEQLCARLASRTLATNELRLMMELDGVVEENNPPQQQTDNENTHSRVQLPDYSITQLPNSSVRPRLGGQFNRTLRLPVPMCDARVFLKLLQLDLKSHPPGAPVIKVAIAAEPVRPQVAQHGLFTPQGPEPEKLQLMLARIAGIVGEGNLGSPEVLDTHRPGAFAMRPFEPQVSPSSFHLSKTRPRKTTVISERRDFSPAENAQKDNRGSLPGAPCMALRIFRPPLPAIVEVRDGRPVHLAFAAHAVPAFKVASDIIWTAGPWRTSGAWWEGAAISPPAFHAASHNHDPASTENQKLETGNSRNWSRDEWDIAVLRTDIAILKMDGNPAALAAGRVVPIDAAGSTAASSAFVLYRLVHDLPSGKWFVEGSYD
jgi:protein ImuB